MAFLALALLVLLGPPLQGQQRDIVLFLTDDQPWHTSQYMPRTNALIGRQGVDFRHAYAETALCCPSRATILTGLFTHNHGVLTNHPPNGGAPAFNDVSTVATWLRGAGYRTALIGKYLNDYGLLTPKPYIPPGWVRWFVAAFGYYDFTALDQTVRVHYDSLPGNYQTDVLAREAVKFIQHAPRNQRILLMLTIRAPHVSPVPAAEDIGSFDSLPDWRPPAFNEADVSDKPTTIQALPLLSDREQKDVSRDHRLQVETLQAVDRAVASVVDALRSTGRLSNAALVFTTDNGYSLGEHRIVGKQCVYEECSRVPLLIRAPGVVPRVDDEHVVSLVDLAPTFAEWAGISPGSAVNGRSLVPLLRDSRTSWRQEVLIERFSGHSSFQAVHSQRFVYAEYGNGDREFYDLRDDPFQLQNAIDDPASAGRIARLARRLEELRQEGVGGAPPLFPRLDPQLPLGGDWDD